MKLRSRGGLGLDLPLGLRFGPSLVLGTAGAAVVVDFCFLDLVTFASPGLAPEKKQTESCPGAVSALSSSTVTRCA